MKHFKALNEQINDTQTMINNTMKFLQNNTSDTTLDFMLKQDKLLLKSLKKERTKELLTYLKDEIDTPEQLLTDVYNTIPNTIDPKFIATSLGIKIIKNDQLGDDEAAKCYIEDEIIIEYKPQVSNNRERFSMAHELGHIIKHMPYVNNAHFEDSSRLLYARNDNYDSLNRQEREADIFANNLLIPKQKLDEFISALNEDEKISATLLSDLFKVSEGTMYHALKQYDMLNSSKIIKDFIWD